MSDFTITLADLSTRPAGMDEVAFRAAKKAKAEAAPKLSERMGIPVEDVLQFHFCPCCGKFKIVGWGHPAICNPCGGPMV